MDRDGVIKKTVDFWVNSLDAKHPTLDQAKEAFASRLRDGLSRVDDLEDFFLQIDYHPYGMLAEALESAGLEESSLPRKTWTVFRDGKVEAKTGYGGEIVEL